MYKKATYLMRYKWLFVMKISDIDLDKRQYLVDVLK